MTVSCWDPLASWLGLVWLTIPFYVAHSAIKEREQVVLIGGWYYNRAFRARRARADDPRRQQRGWLEMEEGRRI